LNLVVETDYPGSRRSERTLILKEDGTPGRPDQDLPHSFVLETIPEETRSARPRTLRQFVEWGMKHFPADHYALVIGSHGMNWRGVIEDGGREEVMSLAGLRSTLRAFAKHRGSPLELLIFDACRMSFGEVTHSLKGQVRYLLGSQFDVNGFDHASPLGELVATPHLSARQLGERYVHHYPRADAGEPDFSSSLVSLDSNQVERFERDLDEISHLILTFTESDRLRLKKNLNFTQNEYRDLAVDVGHLVETLVRIRPDLSERLEGIRARWIPSHTRFDSTGAIHHTHDRPDAVVIAASSTAGSSPAHGLSLTCSPESASYAASPFGRRHPAWVLACRILLP
jgi:hypothetical protein